MSDQWTERVDYGRLAADYAQHRNLNPSVLEPLLESLDSRSRVLEVGCGTGNYIGAVRAVVGCECVGVDPAPEMLAGLRDRVPDVATVVGRAESLDLEPDSFDLVFSVDVIHHVQDQAAAFREALRVLRPGGRVCTVTDSEWVIRHREPLTQYFPETVEVELARYPTVEFLRSAMDTVGFLDLREDLVEFTYELTDSTPFRAKVFSSLLYIDEAAFRRGLRRLEEDLERGPMDCTSRYSMLWGRKAGVG